jgi:hypothetical protein
MIIVAPQFPVQAMSTAMAWMVCSSALMLLALMRILSLPAPALTAMAWMI